MWHQKMYTYALLIVWSMITDLDDYVPTINKQTIVSNYSVKPTSELKLFKK